MHPMWLMGLTSWLPNSQTNYPVLAWAQPIQEDVSLGAEYGQPTLLNEKIFVGVSSSPGVLVFEESTGAQLDLYTTEASVQSQPLMFGDTMFVADTSGVVYAFERSSKKLLWSRPTNSPIMSNMVYQEESIVVSTVDNAVYRLSTDGELIWRHQYEAKISRAGELNIFGGAAPVFHKDAIYVGFSDGGVQKIAFTTGDVLSNVWMGEGRYPDIVSPACTLDDAVILSGFEGPTIAYDLDLGKELWRLDSGRAAGILVEGNNAFIAQSNGSLLSVDVHTGAIFWEWDSGLNANLTTPLSFGDSIFLGSVQGTLYQINKNDGSLLWEHKNETLDVGFSAPVIINDKYLVALSNERILYSFALGSNQSSVSIRSSSQPGAMLLPTMDAP